MKRHEAAFNAEPSVVIIPEREMRRIMPRLNSIAARRPTAEGPIINGIAMRVYEFKTLAGPLGAGFQCPGRDAPAMAVTAYEPALLGEEPALRAYNLEFSTGSFFTDVTPQKGAPERTPEEYATLADAGIYTPSEQEWKKFKKLISDIDLLTDSINRSHAAEDR